MDTNFFYTHIYFSLPACFHAFLELDSGDWWAGENRKGDKDQRRKSHKVVKRWSETCGQLLTGKIPVNSRQN